MLSDDSHWFFACKNVATPFAFHLARRYLQAAENQITRIWEPSVVNGDQEAMLIDIHFYFVALRDVYRFLNKVVSDEVFGGLLPKLAELNDKWFKHYSLGRDAFEHIDQRFPGERYSDRIVEIEEKGAKRKIHFGLKPSQGLFQHSDLEWDISRATFDLIKADVEDLLQLIVEKSSETQ